MSVCMCLHMLTTTRETDFVYIAGHATYFKEQQSTAGVGWLRALHGCWI